MRCSLPLAILLLVSAARFAGAQAAIAVEGVWYDPDRDGGTLEYRIRTNLPDKARMDLSFDSQFDSVTGPLVRSAIHGKAEVSGGECKGKLTGFAAVLPPGRYSFTAAVSARQREEVEQALAGSARPSARKEVFVAVPSQLVRSCEAEADRIAKDIERLGAFAAKIDEWADALAKGKLADRGAEYVAWRDAARKEVDALIERAALYHDKFPTHFPACYAALSDTALHLGEHESALFRLAQGKKGSHEEDAPSMQDLGHVGTRIAELRFKYVWEVSFTLLDLPAELARMAAPEDGIPRREDWQPWRKDLEEATTEVVKLARDWAPGVPAGGPGEGVVRARGVEAPLPRESAEDAKRNLNTGRTRVLKEVPSSVEPARKALLGLLKAADDAAGSAPAPLPDGVRKMRDDLVEAQEKVRAEMRTFFK